MAIRTGRFPVQRVRIFILGLTLSALLPTAARAGWLAAWNARRDDCAPRTRHSSAETRCEHERSKRLQDLDCAGLVTYAEAQRLRFNQQTFAAYTRFPTTTLAEPAAPATPPPLGESAPVFAPVAP